MFKKIEDLQPYQLNAKIHDQTQIAKIAASIQAFGFWQPVIVDKNGVIVIGHGRVEAAKLLGIEDLQEAGFCPKGERFVPYLIADGLSDDEIKAYRITDNRLNESHWDLALVKTDFETLSPELAELTGFTLEDLGEIALQANQEITADALNDKRSLTFQLSNSQYLAALDWLADIKEKNQCETNEEALLSLFQ
jgi:ParB-like chromosome segregation protein Spo0J